MMVDGAVVVGGYRRRVRSEGMVVASHRPEPRAVGWTGHVQQTGSAIIMSSNM